MRKVRASTTTARVSTGLGTLEHITGFATERSGARGPMTVRDRRVPEGCTEVGPGRGICAGRQVTFHPIAISSQQNEG